MRHHILLLALATLLLLPGCTGGGQEAQTTALDSSVVNVDSFAWEADRFADVRVLRYRIPGWEKLNLQQRKLAYYLVMAGLSGRDIMWDQNHRHNLKIRRALEGILRSDKVDRKDPRWEKFLEYSKEVFFSSGIHHHYGMEKFTPGFERGYFEELLATSGADLAKDVVDLMFDPTIDPIKVSLDPTKDLVLASAVNFYGEDVNQKEVEDFYAAMEVEGDTSPVSYGLNSRIVRGKDGKLEEQVWRVGGMYDGALREVVKWLELAKGVAESPEQAAVIDLLIQYYNTGDLRKWDEFNIAWVALKPGAVDFIQGFVEVYNDPMGKRGSYESVVEIIDPEATRNMSVIQNNAQYFEDNSPLLPEHKKAKVTGITYGFVNVAGESGDAAPSTPIGVNLPNADWIRARHGSKSVSLGNISEAYDRSGGKGSLEEFCHDAEEIARAEKHAALAGKLHTALHEVIGHASGQIEKGVGQTDETLKNYASTIEEGRADLVALYYMLDPKLVEWGVMPDLEVGKAEYDGYIRNGLMVQLRRIKPGNNIQEAHMRNRMWVSAWCFEQGAKDSVIVKVKRDGKTFYDIRDYAKLRDLFGQLLRETQRIKSQGDFKAAQALVEGYGVKVDPDLHAEVLKRSEKLKTPPYAGFIQPRLVPVTDAQGNITDVRVEYPTDFLGQMLEYGEKFGFLPNDN
ncbi:MAG: dihydrofolate reductase [Flavobacteriales bacterium]